MAPCFNFGASRLFIHEDCYVQGLNAHRKSEQGRGIRKRRERKRE